MRKQLLILMSVLLLIGLAVAGGSILNINKDIPLDSNTKTILARNNLTDYEVTDSQVGEQTERCLYKKNVMYSCKTFDSYNTKEMDAWEKSELVFTASVMEKKGTEVAKTKLAEGVSVIR